MRHLFQSSLLLATATMASANTRTCFAHAGTSSSGCVCSNEGASTCMLDVCLCSLGGCSGDDNKCYEGQPNVQMGGENNSQVYRIVNARWPKWYMYVSTSNAQIYVKEGRHNTEPTNFQWTIMTPPSSNQHPSRLMFSEWQREASLVYGTRRLCTHIQDGVELELMNASAGEEPDDDIPPGPDGIMPAGFNVNGEAEELVVENETAREEEIALNEQAGDEDDWLDLDDEEEEAGNQAELGELSHRSRYTSTRSRSYSSSRSRSYVYSRSRSFSSFSHRSRTFYHRSRSFNSYTYYYYDTYTDSRRRTYCRDVAYATVVNVASASTTWESAGIQIEAAPVSSGVPGIDLYMLRAAKYPNQYLFVPRFASTVDVHLGDPGAGAYWFFDPPLPAGTESSFSAFTGTRCSWFCAEVGDIVEATLVSGAHRPGKVITFFVGAAAAASSLVFCAP